MAERTKRNGALGIGVFALLLVLASCHPRQITVVQPAERPFPRAATIAVVADPQIHNMYGRRLFSASPLTNAVSAVAVRPPVLNILATLTLGTLVRQATSTLDEDGIALVLGDATNFACTGEYDEFAETMDVSSARPWLMAHGNHDSFMLGVTNSFLPGDEELGFLADRVRSGDFDLERVVEKVNSGWEDPDLYFWRPSTARVHAYGRVGASPPENAHSWSSVCAQPRTLDGAETSTPMNKLQWLAYYLAHLNRLGVEFETAASREGCPRRFVGVARDGTHLARLGYRLEGCWETPPVAENGRSHDIRRYNQNVWKAFVVQAFEVDGTRFVILDSSVAEDELEIGVGKAGNHGRFGPQQESVAEAMIGDSERGTRLVLAAHVSLDQLVPESRTWLEHRTQEYPGMEYLSAHTHNETSRKQVDLGDATIVETNVASTTDWPIEALVASWSSGGWNGGLYGIGLPTQRGDEERPPRLGIAQWREPRSTYPQLEFTWRMGRLRPLRLNQLCIHAASALQLLNYIDSIDEEESDGAREYREGTDRCDAGNEQEVYARLESELLIALDSGDPWSAELVPERPPLGERVAYLTREVIRQVRRRARSNVALASRLLRLARIASLADCHDYLPHAREPHGCSASLEL